MRTVFATLAAIGAIVGAGLFFQADTPPASAQVQNPDITIDYVFGWTPPVSGVPADYEVAVDNPTGTQLNPPGTVHVTPPATQVTVSTFLTGQPLGDNYTIYVRAVDSNENVGPYLVVPFDFVGIGAPTGGTFSLP